MRGRRAALAGLFAATACSPSMAPRAVDTKNDTCAVCRMAVSDARFAGQVVAPHEEPLLFDDLGCLGREWRATPRPGAVAYVADHRNREWVLAERAVWTRVPGLETPMGSGLLAHKDAASRDQDPDARGGTNVPAAEVLGPARGEGGTR